MAQTIKLKRSGTQNAVPSTSQLALGEVAINTYDGKMYIKKNDGSDSIVEIGGDATSSSGLDFTGNLSLEDNVRIVIGDGNDLQIYHDGSNSIIQESGTGDLRIRAQNLRLQDNDGTNFLYGVYNGRVELFHNNSKKFETTSAGAQVTGKLFISDTSNGLEIGASKARFKVNGDDTVIDAIPTGGGINFRTGGAVQRMHIDENGNVGIGTTSPGRKLTVQGASGDNLPVRIIGGSGTSHGSIEFKDPNTTADYKVSVGSKCDDFYIQAGGGEKVRFKSDGRVGIGTTAPAKELHIASIQPEIRLQDTDGTNHYSDIMSSAGNLYLQSRKGADNGKIIFRGLGGGSATEYARFDSNGNFSIGNTNSGAPLVVQSNSNAQGILVFGRSSDDISQLDFSENDGTSIGGFQARTTDFRIRSVQNLPLLFMTNNTERVRIHSGGQLGIGVTDFTNALRGSGKQLIIGSCFVGTGAALVADDFARFGGALYIHEDSGTNKANLTSLDNNGDRLVITGKGGTTNNALDAPDGFYVGGTQFITSSRAITNVTNITGSGVVNAGTHLNVNSSGNLLKVNVSAWTSNGNNDQAILWNGYNSTIGDHIVLKAAGNTTTHGAIVVADNVFSYGSTTSAISTSASLTAPLSNGTAFTVSSGGNAAFAGTLSSSGTGTSSFAGPVTVNGTTLANAFEFQVNGDAKITNYLEAAQATFGNTTLTGFLRGPSTLSIDPATHGDDT